MKTNNKNNDNSRGRSKGYKGKGYRGKPKTDSITITERETPPITNPETPKVSAKSMALAVSSFRGLRDKGLIEVYADPGSNPMRAGYPIPAIGQNCPVTEPGYAGNKNIAGNILVEMMDSDNSKLLNNIDGATATTRLRYLYLCYDKVDPTGENKVNLGLNAQMLNSFFTALSDLEGTMTTDLPLFTSKFTSSMPDITESEPEKAHAEGIMNALIHYQTVLQNITHPISKYIQTISLQKYAQDMVYNREGAFVNKIYAQLMKTAYRSSINAIGESISSEFLDLSWKSQMNILSSFSSRRSNSLDSTLKTMVVTTQIPKLTRSVVSGSTELVQYDSDQVLKASGVWFDPDDLNFVGTTESPVTYDLETLVYKYCKLIDVNTILSFARRKANGTLPVIASTLTASGYYEQSIRYLNAISDIFTVFKTKMGFIRSALIKLNMSGLVYWQKNRFIRAENIGDAKIIYNSLLEDIFSAALGGCADIAYDDNTKRWSSWTMWDKFTGVPGYDDVSGGAFLTFSLRALPSIVNQNYTSLTKLPLLFANTIPDSETTFYCQAYNRLGTKYDVTYDKSNDLGTIPALARLDLINQDIPVKIPKVTLDGEFEDNESAASACLKFIQDCCGYGKVVDSNDSEIYGVRDSLVGFIDFQVDDLTNEMISFCKNYSPFRISTPDPKRTIGFAPKMTTDVK